MMAAMLASILPSVWFHELHGLILLLIGAVALYVVMRGADLLVEASAQLAMRLGMPKVVVGATIVSLGTTSPETAVSVIAAWTGKSGLALGNGVGSIVADTGLIFGIGCLMVALPANRYVLRRQGWVQFGVAVLLAACCYGKWLMFGDAAQLSWYIGLLLLAVLGWYLWVSVKWAKGHDQHAANEPDLDSERVDEAVHHSERNIVALLLLGVAGLAMVVVGGDAAVQSASELAVRMGVPEVILAATLVAIGTSLPELVIGVTSIRKGHPELLVGNVIGADILNVLWVIGLSAVGGGIAGAGLPIVEDGNRVFLYLHLPTMLGMLVLFRLFIARAMRTGSFARWMGFPLLAIYVAYVVLQYAIAV